jgi:hypothetical protein
MTARQPTDPDGEWLTVEQAETHLGLSPSGLRGLAKTEGLDMRRRGNRPGVRRTDVDAYVERARIRPGEITGGRNLNLHTVPTRRSSGSSMGTSRDSLN